MSWKDPNSRRSWLWRLQRDIYSLEHDVRTFAGAGYAKDAAATRTALVIVQGKLAAVEEGTYIPRHGEVFEL